MSEMVAKVHEAIRAERVNLGGIFVDALKGFFEGKLFTHVIFTAIGGVGVVYGMQKMDLAKDARRRKRAGLDPLYDPHARKRTKSDAAGTKVPRLPKIAVNAQFFERIRFIMRLVVPSFRSREFLTICVQTYILLARSLLTMRMAKLTGLGIASAINRSWSTFLYVCFNFFICGVASSVTNSALKFLKHMISLQVRTRLTRYVHAVYLRDRNYYRTVVAQDGGSRLDNADQRIVQDLNDFATTASDLFQRTFKPLLDVVLNTGGLAANLGYKGPLILYSYFLMSAVYLTKTVPAFGRVKAKEQQLEGNFRRSHARLIAHAEEIAFLQGGERERQILNEELAEVAAHTQQEQVMRMKQGVVDQWVMKYQASMIGYPVICLPFLFYHGAMTSTEIAVNYRYSDQLIRNASGGISDLMMVYKRVQNLAGYTARVSELLESLEEGNSSSNLDAGHDQADVKGTVIVGSEVKFENVDVITPHDNRLLIKQLCLTLKQGQSLMVTGPNGAGKTSLFRVVAGLWPLRSGTLTRPAGTENDMFYVPQNPYLVSGTLRDQVIYPHAFHSEDGVGVDEEVTKCLEFVGLKKLLERSQEGEGKGTGLDKRHHDWYDVLSGGEKQRVGLARLFYHKPKFAILDESTSAVNVDEEGPMYQRARDLGITLYSIAHRLALRRFHDFELRIEGDGTGAWTLTKIQHDQ